VRDVETPTAADLRPDGTTVPVVVPWSTLQAGTNDGSSEAPEMRHAALALLLMFRRPGAAGYERSTSGPTGDSATGHRYRHVP